MFWGLSELGGLGGWVRLIKHLLAAAPAFDKQKRPRSKSREVHQSNFRKLPINFEESGLDPKVNFSTWQNMFLLTNFQNSPFSFSVRNFDNPPKHPKSQHLYATVHLEVQLNTKKQCTLCIWLFCEIFIETFLSVEYKVWEISKRNTYTDTVLVPWGQYFSVYL